ncbi:DUF418 domain-containing protein [Colwellia piezophila]|uniref:DUF418 domain-containing protein n=1 Tax=Colwellia piezophila TaxID=211668 RepID=UPI000373DB71|nr:DUF418 domain-containing protein [Colwellia piezophila]
MRIQSIDILRGIAILGILFMNIYYHGFFTAGYVELMPKPPSDTAIEIINAVFFDGRFRTLFCLLFGAGLAIQYKSCKKKQISAKFFLTARMKWLMGFGLLHGIFIFGGDILLLYGICALTILSSLALPLKCLYKKAIKFLSIGITITIALTVLFVFVIEEPTVIRNSDEYREMYTLWFSGYGYQILQQGGTALALVLLSPISAYWQLAGLMLLGAFLYRVGFFKKGFTNAQLIKVALAAVILTGIETTLMLTVPAIDSVISSEMANVSAIFVALLYAHIVVRVVNNQHSFIKLFAAPGKLALSLYIFQSITMAVLLRIWNQDFHLTAHRLDYVLIALVFTVLQIGLAHWYLRYFSQGPLEYIWRKAYWRSFTKAQTSLPEGQQV